MYHCVHCDTIVNVLYIQYTNEIIKMELCPNCNQVSDHYIEYDLFLIIIDLLVGKLEAYRHMIYNTSGSYINKTILSVFMNSFLSWLSEVPKSKIHLENISISVRYDLHFYMIYDLLWSFTFYFLIFIVCFFFLKKSNVRVIATKILLIVNYSRILCFFLLPWKSEFFSYFLVGCQYKFQFYSLVSTFIALTPCIQSVCALNNYYFMVNACIGLCVCTLSLLSATYLYCYIEFN